MIGVALLLTGTTAEREPTIETIEQDQFGVVKTSETGDTRPEGTHSTPVAAEGDEGGAEGTSDRETEHIEKAALVGGSDVIPNAGEPGNSHANEHRESAHIDEPKENGRVER